MAELTAAAVHAGRRVLVRCRHGYNRSGLVIAHALVLLGHQPDAVIGVNRCDAALAFIAGSGGTGASTLVCRRMGGLSGGAGPCATRAVGG